MKYMNLSTMEVVDMKETELCIPLRAYNERKSFEPTCKDLEGVLDGEQYENEG